MARGRSVGVDDRRRILVGGVIAATLVAVAILLAITGGSGGGSSATVVDATPRIVGADALEELESTSGHPLYWAGERPPAQLEVREEAEGSVYLRYLPPGVEAGDPEQVYLTVGTYPVTDAVAALERTADKAGTEVEEGPGGAVLLPNPASAGSVYFAYPETDVQVEVYDPAPGRSLQLIRSGQVKPVGAER